MSSISRTGWRVRMWWFGANSPTVLGCLGIVGGCLENLWDLGSEWISSTLAIFYSMSSFSSISQYRSMSCGTRSAWKKGSFWRTRVLRWPWSCNSRWFPCSDHDHNCHNSWFRMFHISSWYKTYKSERQRDSAVGYNRFGYVLIARSCLIMSHHVSSCLIMSHHVSSCLIMSHHVSSCLIMSHHVSSCLIMSHHVSSCLIMSHHVSSVSSNVSRSSFPGSIRKRPTWPKKARRWGSVLAMFWRIVADKHRKFEVAPRSTEPTVADCTWLCRINIVQVRKYHHQTSVIWYIYSSVFMCIQKFVD